MNKEFDMKTIDENNNEKDLKDKDKNTFLVSTNYGESRSSTNLANLDKFLENEKNNNANEPWSKLDKTAKIRKLTVFAELYKEKHSLNDSEHKSLLAFLKDCLDRKKLQRVKDVIYDKSNGEVKDIPALYFSKPNNHFTLKNIDKRVSTTRSLAPKKINVTIKNINKDSDSESEV